MIIFVLHHHKVSISPIILFISPVTITNNTEERTLERKKKKPLINYFETILIILNSIRLLTYQSFSFGFFINFPKFIRKVSII